MNNSLFNEMLLLDTDLIWVDVVSQFTYHLLNRANFAIPVETKFLQNAFKIDNCDFVTCVSPEHLNFGTADDIS